MREREKEEQRMQRMHTGEGFPNGNAIRRINYC